MSTAPFSSRNSARWKPSGSFSRTVCSMTRGPAKPMSARGSAITVSPVIRKLAETPPMVGGSECGEARCVLGHLHEREQPFLHARPAGRRDAHERQLLVEAGVHAAH